jgi:hypothetical protein
MRVLTLPTTLLAFSLNTLAFAIPDVAVTDDLGALASVNPASALTALASPPNNCGQYDWIPEFTAPGRDYDVLEYTGNRCIHIQKGTEDKARGVKKVRNQRCGICVFFR